MLFVGKSAGFPPSCARISARARRLTPHGCLGFPRKTPRDRLDNALLIDVPGITWNYLTIPARSDKINMTCDVSGVVIRAIPGGVRAKTHLGPSPVQAMAEVSRLEFNLCCRVDASLQSRFGDSS
jgi:hypothetical protein